MGVHYSGELNDRTFENIIMGIHCWWVSTVYRMQISHYMCYFKHLSLVPILYSKQVIESFSYEVFYAFIKYLYTDEVNIKPEHEIGKW